MLQRGRNELGTILNKLPKPVAFFDFNLLRISNTLFFDFFKTETFVWGT